MVDNYDYFAIPDFLDRKKWTPAQWEQSKQAWQKIQQDAGRIARADRRDRDRSIRAAESDKNEKQRLKAERRRGRLERKDRAKQRQFDRQKVVELIRFGSVTLGQMGKTSDIPAERIKAALRWLLRNERISKPTPRTYRV
tara:strand:+ start:229 stop:648 length:420 start_codon:yes stop_codon:yes gene_type:complete